MLADFLSILPFPLSSPPLPFWLPFPSLLPSFPLPFLLPLSSICMRFEGWVFPHMWAYRHQRSVLLSTLHWRQALSLDWSSVIQLNWLPANLRDPPVFSSLVLGVFMTARQFTYGVSTQPSLPFLNLRLFGGGDRTVSGGLKVTTCWCGYCNTLPDSVNNFISQSEISVDNLFSKNVIGKVTNNRWLRESDKYCCQFKGCLSWHVLESVLVNWKALITGQIFHVESIR